MASLPATCILAWALALLCKGTQGSDSAPCVFPFTYNGKVYTACTTEDSDQPWVWPMSRLVGGGVRRAPLVPSLSSIRVRPTTAVRLSMTRWEGPGVLPLPTTTKTISGASALARPTGGTPMASAARFLLSTKNSYFTPAPTLETRWDISGAPQPTTTTGISCGATAPIPSWVGTRQERAVRSPSSTTNKCTTPAPATGRARDTFGAAPPGITTWTRSGLTAPHQTTTAPPTASPVSSPSSTRSLNSTPAPTWRRPAGSSGVPAQTTMTETISGATALP
ncbi:unnamed protein product, partial [Eretmochelys imbricata]